MTASLSAPPSALAPADLEGSIRRGGRALVALSGGVDSAVVALLARRALGEEAVAVTLTGPAVSDAESRAAEEVARSVGIPHVVLRVDPLTVPEYRANPTDRCFYCREIESSALLEYGRPRGFRQFLDGVHRDDVGEVRPGLRAMDAAGFRHPLLDAGWGKTEVRAFARGAGLPNWDRPSNACLASRVRHGSPISEELLRRIDAAESHLVAQGFRRVRVRVEGARARVEVDPDEVARLLETPLAGSVREALNALGFLEVSLDPRGYRSGKGVA
jgi:uncharacterized protein